MVPETDWAWLAGFIDGEGHIGLTTLGSGKYGRRRFTLRLAVYNTHRPTIDYIVERFPGGRPHWQKNKGSKLGKAWRDEGSVHWNTAAAVGILKQVLPYLFTKKEQALTALAFQALLNPPEHRSADVPEANLAQRELLRQRMATLNGKMTGTYEPVVRPTLTCQECGKDIAVYTRARKYCSQDCALRAGRKFYEERHIVEKTCPQCGETFRTQKSKQIYCSLLCGRYGPMEKWKASMAQRKLWMAQRKAQAAGEAIPASTE